jgi:hypothetical protein
MGIALAQGKVKNRESDRQIDRWRHLARSGVFNDSVDGVLDYT